MFTNASIKIFTNFISNSLQKYRSKNIESYRNLD